MRQLTLALVLFASGCFTSSLTPPGTLPPPDGMQTLGRAMDATVALVEESGRSYCAGVLVRSNAATYLLTAAHCTDNTPDIRFILRSSAEQHLARLIRADEVTDMAVLSPADVLPAGTQTAALAPETPRVGERVVVVGHPIGLRWFVTVGLSNGIRDVFGSIFLLHSAPVYFGNSGGPVFNEYGEVIGITSFMAGGQPHLAGAVPLPVIEAALHVEAARARAQ